MYTYKREPLSFERLFTMCAKKKFSDESFKNIVCYVFTANFEMLCTPKKVQIKLYIYICRKIIPKHSSMRVFFTATCLFNIFRIGNF